MQADAEQGERHTLKIGVMPSLDHLPLVLAKVLGQTDSLGLDLEFVRFYSPMDRDVALQTGQVDGAVTDYTSFLIQQAQGLPLEMPLALEGKFYLVARQDLKLSNLEDLVGKRFALSSNTVIAYATDRLMQERAYTPVEIQKLPLRLEMLQKGEVDVAILPEPFATLAGARGMQVLDWVADGDKPLQVTGLTLARSKAEQTDLLNKLTKAYQQGVDALPRLSEVLPQVAEVLGVDAPVLSQIKLSHMRTSVAPKAEELEEAKLWLRAKGLI